MKWKSSQNLAENASSMLPKLAEKYFSAGRAAAKETSAKKLHRFRLATKQFRYSLELFQPVYGSSLNRHLKSLRGIQDALGKISDFQTIEEAVKGDKKLAAKLARAKSRKIREFRKEWKKFDSSDQLKGWKTYLTRQRTASPPPAKRAAR